MFIVSSSKAGQTQLLSFPPTWLSASCHGNMFCRNWISIWLSYLVSGLALFLRGLECYLVNFETLGMWLKKLICYLGKWLRHLRPYQLGIRLQLESKVAPPLFLDSSSYHIDFFLHFSHIAEVDVHCHPDFGDNFCCHLWPSQAFARGFCKCPLDCHVILLSEAPTQPRVAEVAAQNTVQPAM